MLILVFFYCFVSFATWQRMSITIYFRLLHNFLFSCLTQIDLFLSSFFFLINLHNKNSIDKKKNETKKKLNDSVSCVYESWSHIECEKRKKNLSIREKRKWWCWMHHFPVPLCCSCFSSSPFFFSTNNSRFAFASLNYKIELKCYRVYSMLLVVVVECVADNIAAADNVYVVDRQRCPVQC